MDYLGGGQGCSVVENDFIPQPTMKDLLDELEHSLYSRSGESSSARRTNLPVGVSSPSSTLMDPWARDFCISCAPDELDAPYPWRSSRSSDLVTVRVPEVLFFLSPLFLPSW